jgi:YD repeat-containing protein
VVAGFDSRTGANLIASYTYNVLDNLTDVAHGARPRSFTYDGLGRLKGATNPESGSTTYAYDLNGNLATKTDARTFVTTFGYDVLNRLTSKTYSDGTAAVAYTYDQDVAIAGDVQPNYPVGRLTRVGNSASETLFRYDAKGRTQSSAQTTGGVSYPFRYSYNLADGLSGVVYPSGLALTYGYDGAGRVESLSGTRAGQNRSYATGIGYAPHGPVSQMTLGNGVAETALFNSRMQMETITAHSGLGDTLLSLALNYGASDNNGNVRGQTITAGAEFTHAYGYDALNRIKEISENGALVQKYLYDAYGNRAVLSGAQHLIPGGSWTPQVPSETDDVTALFPGNRWAQAAHDPAGNVTGIPGLTFTYDAENRMVRATRPTADTTYAYDGEGRRVKKVAGDGTTIYVYDAMGQLAAEYGPALAEGGTRYLTADHVGSTRLVTDAAGAVKERLDYLPFGEEIPRGFNGRSTEYPSGFYPDLPRTNTIELRARNGMPKRASITSGRDTSRAPKVGLRRRTGQPSPSRCRMRISTTRKASTSMLTFGTTPLRIGTRMAIGAYWVWVRRATRTFRRHLSPPRLRHQQTRCFRLLIKRRSLPRG